MFRLTAPLVMSALKPLAINADNRRIERGGKPFDSYVLIVAIYGAALGAILRVCGAL